MTITVVFVVVVGVAVYHIIPQIFCFFDCSAPEAHVMEPGVAVEVVLLADLVAHGVHQDVDAHDLVELAHAQFAEGLHCFEVDVARGRHPEEQGYGSEELDANLHEVIPTSLNHPSFAAKDANIEESKEATHAMNLDCLDGIIDATSL